MQQRFTYELPITPEALHAHVEAVSDATWLYSPEDSQFLSLRDL